MLRIPCQTWRGWGLTLALTAGVAPLAGAQTPDSAPPTPTQTQTPSAVRLDQIDRYEAIRQLQTELKTNPNKEANWIILGEIAHEIAYELAGEQDTPYYQMSRQAYENALKLNPTSKALQAAVQFAKDQEAGATQFDDSRRQAVPQYLANRRRELTESGAGPNVRVYSQPPTPSRSVPPQGTPATTSAAVPTYRPYYQAQGGQPYSYRQYSSETLPSVSTNMGGGTPRLGASDPATTGGAVKPAAAAAPP